MTYRDAQSREQSSAPKSFKELIDSKMLYSEALEEMMSKVITKANSVLENVQKKGALTGDIMDKQTESMLRPQKCYTCLAFITCLLLPLSVKTPLLLPCALWESRSCSSGVFTGLKQEFPLLAAPFLLWCESSTAQCRESISLKSRSGTGNSFPR